MQLKLRLCTGNKRVTGRKNRKMHVNCERITSFIKSEISISFKLLYQKLIFLEPGSLLIGMVSLSINFNIVCFYLTIQYMQKTI